MTIFIASLSSPSIQLEFLGYSIATLESINLTVKLAVCALRGRKPGLEALRRLARSMIAVSILLAAAALLEAIMLASSGLRASYSLTRETVFKFIYPA
ncbi:MAG: hypothetical protein QXL31_06010 [Thermosphaera sp.]